MAEKDSIAYLGPRDTYTYQAALQYFKGADDDQLLPQETIKGVFTAVQTSKALRGVVPFENSSQGPVSFTLDILANHEQICPDVQVYDETYLPIHHSLVGIRNSPTQEPSSSTAETNGLHTNKGDAHTQLDTDFSKIQRVYSHPQALLQCKKFLAQNLAHAKLQEVSSTSRAAELVAADKSGTSAAITSKTAAEMNNLAVLASHIEDSTDNTTRFFILERTSSKKVNKEAAESFVDSSNATKSLISFTIEHERPGTLAEALLVFQSLNLNLTNIVSRPSGQRAWHYIFLVEIRSSQNADAKKSIEEALRRLNDFVESHRWLGLWRDRGGSRPGSSTHLNLQ